MSKLAVSLATALSATATALACLAPQSGAPASAPLPAACPETGAGPWSSCVIVPATTGQRTGQQITAGSVNPGTPWMVTDKTGAPMAWVNLYGLYSGGDGGKMPGGLICVTNGVLATVACLTPQGDLTLGTGPDQVTLTPADIRFLHSIEHSTR